MNEPNVLIPNKNETPSNLAYRYSQLAAAEKHAQIKQQLGQFFTPPETALFMAGFMDLGQIPEIINILEPGVGTAILACSFIEEIIKNNKIIEINLDCYEIDLSIIPYTTCVLEYLKEWLNKQNIVLTYNLVIEDYIVYNKSVFEGIYNGVLYDFIISNPPFFKLPNNDERVKIASQILHGLPNIYSIFFYISTLILKKEGKLLYLIPRSFCSGSFFKLIRNNYLKNIKINKIHLFSSDEKIFDSHSVVYEFVIVECQKNIEELNNYNINITHANNIHSVKNVDYDRNFNTGENIIELPACEEDLSILNKIHSWTGSLKKYGCNILHGKLIITACEKYIYNKEGENLVPLLWLPNIETGKFNYPLPLNYGQYLLADAKTEKYILENKNYVLLRRYNNNDYTKRIISTPYLNKYLNSKNIAIERLISCIYKNECELSNEEVIGISAILNSRFINSYLRMINGIINVTAEMILNIPLPDINIIKDIGRRIINGDINDDCEGDRFINW
ncbi:MAG: Eco57I restriction-modification methylase domain-containing protein [bacterium]